MASDLTRVAVFVDWQNVYWCAREAFGLEGRPNGHGNFSPLRLGCLLAAAKGRGRRAELHRVEIFRGLPSLRRDPVGYAANRRQAAAWEAEAPGVTFSHSRPLRYPPTYPTEPPVEKGVDVGLAVAAVGASLRGDCDIAIVFSHDSDLLPVPEAITRLLGPGHVETAAWSSASFRQRLNPKAPVPHHALTENVFELVSTPVNCALTRP